MAVPPSGSFRTDPTPCHTAGVRRGTAALTSTAPGTTSECLLSGEKSGVIVCYGNIASGFVLYADDRALRYEYNAAGDVMAIESELPDDDPLLAGFEFRRVDTSDPGGPGRGRLVVDGDAGGPWVDIPNPLTFLSLSGMDIGHNPLSALSNRYTPPFPFVGDIEQVTFHLRLPEATDTRKLDD